MKVLLCAINAKYIHTNLAVLYLHQLNLCQGWDSHIRSFTINEPISYILSEIYQVQADVIAFSCYIWNIEMIRKVVADLKKVQPEACIVWGGPEVSYGVGGILRDNPQVDCVVSGEGEGTWPELLANLQKGISPAGLSGISCRKGEEILVSDPKGAVLPALDLIPFPYENIRIEPAQVIYYESSRGCPFQCTYCISSLQKGVRFFPLERVKRELEYLVQLNPREIKFVDRTFNCDESWARNIIETILQLPGETRFHMEITPWLLSAGFLDFLEKLPEQRFNFEIGVQSTHQPTLKAVKRHRGWSRLEANVIRLRRAGNIHLHLDLIAGLPQEDYQTFMKSFNKVYSLKPDHLQLGFLKLLPGTSIRQEAQDYGYQYQQHPPYEVLSNHWLSFDELTLLHHIEDVLEKYYNSGLAQTTITKVITQRYDDNPFSFWEELGKYWYQHGYYGIGVGLNERYTVLKDYLDEGHPELEPQHHDWLKYDYLKGRLSYHLPAGLQSLAESSQLLTSLLKKEGFVAQYLPGLAGKSIREIKKRVILESFVHDPADGKILDEPLKVLFVYPTIGSGAEQVIPVSQELSSRGLGK